MSLDIALTDKLGVFLAEAHRCGVDVHPPCVNRSCADFTVEGGAIRYALAAVKNVGSEAMRHVEEERRRGGPFTCLLDFAERVDGRRVGKRGFEQLARAGAFDALTRNRAQAFAAAEFLCRYSASCQEEKSSAQVGLFGDAGPGAQVRPSLPQAEEWTAAERLSHELGAIGFYFSGHPLDDFREELEAKGVKSQAEVMAAAEGTRITCQMAGILREVTPRRSKSGKPFAWLTCSDLSGDFELTVFSELLEACRDVLEPGALLLFAVTAEDREGSVRLTAEGARKLDHEPAAQASALQIRVGSLAALGAIKRRLAAVSQEGGRGAARLLLELPEAGCEVELRLAETVPVTTAVRGAFKSIEGVADVRLLN